MRNIGIVIFVLAVGCGDPGIAGVPDADGAMPMGDAGLEGDALTPPGDAGGQLEDAGADAQLPEPGACEPDRTDDAISHNDCRRYAARPICDALSEACVALPSALCGACETDAQCAAVDIHSRCVFMPGDIPANNDSACLSPCSSDSDCGWITDAYGWTAQARCFDFPAGRFCSPDWGGRTHCRNPDSTRQGS